MSQGAPETTAKPRGIGFSLVYPPGWREFRTTKEHEEQLTKLATAEAKKLGRADVVLIVRRKIHELFEYLRRRGALGFALPTGSVSSGLPVSLMINPLKTGPSGSLAAVVNRVSVGETVEIEEVDGAQWYLWTTNERAQEAAELMSIGLNMVVPRPLPDGSVDPDPKAGLWLYYSYPRVDGLDDQELTDDLRDLGYAILGTFKWVPVQ